MPILGSILTAWLTWAGPYLAAPDPGGRRRGCFGHGHHLGQEAVRPHPPGPCRRRSALRRLAVVPQRPHAQHHGGDRAGGVSGLPADPADRCPRGHDRRGCDLHHRHGPEQGVPGPSLADGRHRRVAAGAGLGGDRDPGPPALPCLRHREHAGPAPTFDHPPTAGGAGRAPRHPRRKTRWRRRGPASGQPTDPRGGATTAG